ncbi:malate dehydrogenase [Diplocarpon rosae]|nr:malate dehydrogenase [Diplocarpon rosae]
MLAQIWLVSALCAGALAAPTLTTAGSARKPANRKILSDYFRMLGRKIQAGRDMAEAPVCNMENAVLPVAYPTPLPPVTEGLFLKHVSVGRGTQNYTCDVGNATAIPVATGAVATLYNASCVAAAYPDLLAALSNVSLQFNLTSADQKTLSPSTLSISGHHYFTNTTTPEFNLNTVGLDLGVAPCQKNASVPAPVGATKGQADLGFGTVPWLKLSTRSGATGGLSEVYRVNTAGGNPPTSCIGQPAAFEVQYAAEYWFYAV